ncbi:hypothetical protein ACFQ3P_18810 [Paraburkholderia sabiae]|jgi:hypothetical protein|uniref:TfoX N-terminal domain-containing protein n=1 Tax=Paraburkholderia sabiae TaxID=273251 RepID=A0ABU9QAU6_9BURK|nr:hypothetical protein [Paraburkholderia sabiae]WJZ72497.1 hypothetical protein QEN71_20315 [Paraburkholderia sabiae]CAD6536242.1 hypothetical protein LMG24235_03072 [Paraburkholderia sabiae]
MKTEPRLLHDVGLFDAVFACIQDKDPSLRAGAMFGCPAAFVGSQLVFCVYGSGIGIKLPAERAAMLVDAGRAFAFQPYGRSAMPEWVEIRIPRERVGEIAPVLIEAVDYAQHHATHAGGKPPSASATSTSHARR